MTHSERIELLIFVLTLEQAPRASIALLWGVVDELRGTPVLRGIHQAAVGSSAHVVQDPPGCKTSARSGPRIST